MFVIEVELQEGTSMIKVDGNACAMYCLLDRKPEETVKLFVQNGVICVDAPCLKLYTSRENRASYEWNLADAEKKLVSLKVDDEIDNPDLKAYLNEDDELDILKLVKDKTSNGENCLFSMTEKVTSKKQGDYEIRYCMTYDAAGQIVRLEYVSTEQKPYEEGISGSYFNKGIISWIKQFTIDEMISFDFCNTPFVELTQKIAAYCEQEDLEIAVRCEEYGIVGHSIYVPCAVVETERFKVVFDLCGDVKEVHVAKGIMDTSSYVESRGEKYVIGDIIWQIKSDNKEPGFIHGFGAENIWHYFFGDESKYIYGCGFNL